MTLCLILFLTTIPTISNYAMITRQYTLPEVLSECTNVAFGKVESVDKERKRVIVRLTENLKGESRFEEIKMNIAVGQVGKLTSPAMMMAKFKVGLPIAILYKDTGGGIECLGHVSGAWFQLFGDSNTPGTWWRFTHIEAYMPRTYNGSTPEFQQTLRDALAGKLWPGAAADAVKVLVLTGNSTKPLLGQVSPNSPEAKRFVATPELVELQKLTAVAKRSVAYFATKDRSLPGLDQANILWIGQGEVAEGKYLLPHNTEVAIKKFVRRGGIAIVMSQDSDQNRPCETGWLPEPLLGVERQLTREFQPTQAAGQLFEQPNRIKSGRLNLDDTWSDWSSKYVLLATTNSGDDIVVATLKYGKGLYIITGLHNETEANLKANAPLMENLLHFAISGISQRKNPRTKIELAIPMLERNCQSSYSRIRVMKNSLGNSSLKQRL